MSAESSSDSSMQSTVVTPALPGRRFVRFEIGSTRPLAETLPADAEPQVTSYQVVDVRSIAGHGVDVAIGAALHRFEAATPPPEAPGSLGWEGVTQHLQYTSADERATLQATSAPPQTGCAVLIPIAKSAAWWNLAQDERHAYFRRAPGHHGHTSIGARYAGRIFRRLYHCRYLPGAEWDFLTYFEFLPEHRDAFLALLGELRDPSYNPEWRFVAREAEIWLSHLAPSQR